MDPGTDAAIDTGNDTGTTMRDAWIAPPPDAFVMPSCPSYATDVRPIYERHCAPCHTTGTSPHFGSSYAVASLSTSACGSPLADCTIQLGSPGGSMSFRDPLGGFSSTDLATLHGWIDCGLPR